MYLTIPALQSHSQVHINKFIMEILQMYNYGYELCCKNYYFQDVFWFAAVDIVNCPTLWTSLLGQR